MKYSFLATWHMALEGVRLAERTLSKGQPALADALCAAVRAVEDNPAFHSVGCGAYPNLDGDVQTDAAYMDGTTFRFGCLAGARDVANPVDVAYRLSGNATNCFLCGDGAETYARRNGHAMRNLLTEEARAYWQQNRHAAETLHASAYAGHDTVCVLGKLYGDMAVAVSTSGLSFKHPGRVGDSPVIGSGFYCDSRVGGAAATGVGEDIQRGCLSYELVRRMESGMSPQQACETALAAHLAKLARANHAPGAISLIALGADGGIGASTTLAEFAFIHADQDRPASVWMAQSGPDGIRVGPASPEALQTYRDA